MRDTIDILGIKVDKVTMSQALEKVSQFLLEDRVHTIYTPNAEILMDAYKDNELKSILNAADLVIPDGSGVVLASRILGTNLTEKVAGVDLTRNTFTLSSGDKIKYFLFGGKPGIAEEAAENIHKQYSGAQVVGCRNGYFKPEDEADIINNINESGADILLVAQGAPKQEKWIYQNRDKLKVKICIGVGGSLDIYAGRSNLAPEFMRKNGLEWLYRLYKEPWRYKRMLRLPKFVFAVLGTKITGR